MNKRFWVIMAVFVGLGVVMMSLNAYFLTKFGQATGRTVEAVTGDSIEGAEVILYGEFQQGKKVMKLTRKGTSGENGDFQIRLTAGGAYRMTVNHPDYETLIKEGVVLEPEVINDLGVVELTPRP